MCKNVIVIGGGGHAKVAIDCTREAGDTVVGILDDHLPIGATVLDVPVLGPVSVYSTYPDCVFLIAIGGNEIRQAISEKLDVKWYTAIHPSAVVSPYAKIGEGSVVFANAVINADVTVGRHCIINTAAVIEHDCVLSDFVHISPRAALAGNVYVDSRTQVGIGASVRQGITICSECIVGAGAVVVENIREKGIYVGIPAKKLCK